jgi:hypothetical protein
VGDAPSLSLPMTNLVQARIALAALAALALLSAPAIAVPAQEVGPPIVEYRGRGVGTFEVRNNSLFPMNVVIEPFGFQQDSLGRITYGPFDTTRLRLRLSAMSLRLPARAALTVSYEAASDTLPAWFVITSTFHGVRRRGINYNFQLPHVVYLYQKTAVRREEVQLADLVVDTAARQARFKMRNTSAGLTRCAEGTLSADGGARVPVPAFPLFPHFERWVVVDWAQAGPPPTKLRLMCSGGELTFDRRSLAAGAGR